MTLTFAGIARARLVLVTVTGEAKREALARVAAGDDRARRRTSAPTGSCGSPTRPPPATWPERSASRPLRDHRRGGPAGRPAAALPRARPGAVRRRAALGPGAARLRGVARSTGATRTGRRALRSCGSSSAAAAHVVGRICRPPRRRRAPTAGSAPSSAPTTPTRCGRWSARRREWVAERGAARCAGPATCHRSPTTTPACSSAGFEHRRRHRPAVAPALVRRPPRRRRARARRATRCRRWRADRPTRRRSTTLAIDGGRRAAAAARRPAGRPGARASTGAAGAIAAVPDVSATSRDLAARAAADPTEAGDRAAAKAIPPCSCPPSCGAAAVAGYDARVVALVARRRTAARHRPPGCARWLRIETDCL